MTKWIETRYDIIKVSYNTSESKSETNLFADGCYSYNYYNPDYSSLNDEIMAVISQLSKGQFEIKSITPITNGTTYNFGYGYAPRSIISGISTMGAVVSSSSSAIESGYGIGYGWGISLIDSILIISQRIEEITEQEQQRRINNAEITQKIENVKKEIDFENRNISEFNNRIKSENFEFKNTSIQEKTKLFGKNSYVIDKIEFKDIGSAKEKFEEIKQIHNNIIANLQEKITISMEKIKLLEEKIEENEKLIL